MNRIHPDDRIATVEIIVTLGDGRTGTARLNHHCIEELVGSEPSLLKQRLFEVYMAAQHAANPKGPRLPPELERIPP